MIKQKADIAVTVAPQADIDVTVTSQAEIEVAIQKAAQLNIEVPVLYVKSGKAEISRYVNEVSKPELNAYTAVSKDNIDNYVNTVSKPAFDAYAATKQAELDAKVEEVGVIAQSAVNAASLAAASSNAASISAVNAAGSATEVQQLYERLGSVYKVKGNVSDFSALPDDAEIGDVYNISDTDVGYVWTGDVWRKFFEVVDLTPYRTAAEQNAIDDVYASHAADADIHVTAADKSVWNDKQNALSSSQLDAVNSGITGAKVSTYDEYATSKQSTLVSGTNIKTVNNESLLGSGNIVIQGGGGASVIGQIIKLAADSGYVPEGCLPCDGAEYTKSQFMNLWNNFLTSNPVKLNTCTYAEYTNEMTTYGQCGKFAVDTDNNTFRIPSIPSEMVTGLKGTAPAGGNGMSLGYTDGTNNFGHRASGNDYTSIYGTPVGNTSNTGQISNAGVGLTRDFSKSGIEVDTSDLAKTIEVRYFVIVADGAVNQSMMDWSQWASNISGKVDKSALIDCVVITETYRNGTEWYQKYSDGWVRQGGWVPYNIGTAGRINLLVPFRDMNYTVTTNSSHASDYRFRVSMAESTRGDLYWVKTNTACGGQWIAEGYADEM